MRKINYEVRMADGSKVFTSDYEVAKTGKIEKTVLTDIDLRSEKEKEIMRKHAERVQNILKAKRG